jgi:6-phosphofructokinase 1
MGRHAGWITAACGLAAEKDGDPPHILLFPEVPFDEESFIARVKATVEKYDYCTVGVSEGLLDKEGKLMAETGARDAFGHAQLGGIGPQIAALINAKLGYKYHWAVADYLQRAARHIASKTDVDQAYAVGKAAVEMAIAGKNAVMPAIRRLSDSPYKWDIVEAPLAQVANVEKKMPKDFITEDGYGITEACRRYLAPLIEGEDAPPYKNGLPDYVRLQNISVAKKLPGDFKI